MIKVVCLYNKNVLNSIEILGHAEANKKGHDLVCSAVSGIVIGAINALEGFNKNNIKTNDGHIKFNIDHEISDADNIRLKMMITQLEIVAKNYPKNIKIIKEK